MSDIRFNRWLHQSGTGGVYQDSSGNIGIGTSTPTSALDIQNGTIKIGSQELNSSGVSTFTTVTATTFTGNLTGNVTGNVTGGITTSQITIGDSFIKSGAVGLGTTDTAGRNAGVGTAVGTLIYNETLGQVQVFKRIAGWSPVSSSIGDYAPISATGGTVETYTDPSTQYVYKSHTFLSSDPGLVVSALSGSPDPTFNTLEYLLVGGGGGTGSSPIGGNREAGSGAGGFLTGTTTATVTTYPVVIGQGGAGGQAGTPNNGGDTTGFGVTAYGGGGGGHSDATPPAHGSPGGSGGGAWYQNGTGGAGYNYPGPNQQGYPGSPGFPAPIYGGGGGGAGGAGGRGTGGAGAPNVYRYGPPTPVTYAAGGAPSDYPGTNNTADGAANTGNGGSGRGSGGSGIVVVRYRTA